MSKFRRFVWPAPSAENVHSGTWPVYQEVRAQRYTFDIRAVDLDALAASLLTTTLKEQYGAFWQNSA